MLRDGAFVHWQLLLKMFIFKNSMISTPCRSVSWATFCRLCYSVVCQRVTWDILYTYSTHTAPHLCITSNVPVCVYVCMCALQWTCGVFSHLGPLRTASGSSSYSSISVGQYHHGCMGRGRSLRWSGVTQCIRPPILRTAHIALVLSWWQQVRLLATF